MKSLTVSHLSTFVCLVLSSAAIGAALSGCQTASPHSYASRKVASPPDEISRDGLDWLGTQTQQQLTDLFATGTAETVPTGTSHGLAIAVAGHPHANWLPDQIWDGKTFNTDGSTGTLENNLIEDSTKKIEAKVYKAKLGDVLSQNNLIPENAASLTSTWPKDKINYAVDGNTSIILDYSHTNLHILRKLYDELRAVPGHPGLYLGRATLDGKFVCYFALQFAVTN